MWRWADVKMRRCEEEQMWRWADVKMRRCERRCEDEKVWRWEGVRWADVKMRRCEEERWEGVKMRRCEDEKVWDEKMRYRPPLLEEPCAQTLSGKKSLLLKNIENGTIIDSQMIYDFNYRWFISIYHLPWFTHGDFPHVTLPPGICCIFWRTHAHALQEQTLLPSFPMHSVLGICKRPPFVEWLNPIVNEYHICILYIYIYSIDMIYGGFSKRWYTKSHFLEHFATPMDLRIPHFKKLRVTALSSWTFVWRPPQRLTQQSSVLSQEPKGLFGPAGSMKPQMHFQDLQKFITEWVKLS